jgi:2-oxoglutarate ferredoxin oxidoreductase subunit alpha
VLSYEDLEAGKRFGRYSTSTATASLYRTYPGTHPAGSFFTRGNEPRLRAPPRREAFASTT